MIRDIICTAVIVLAALALMLAGWPDETATQRETFLRERWELAEAKAVECARLCAKDRELSERSAEAWRLWMASLGMEGRP
jgi:hypothetical protein